MKNLLSVICYLLIGCSVTLLGQSPNVKVVNPDSSPVPVKVLGASGFYMAAYDYVGVTYYGSTNNIKTQVFKTGGSGGTTVATLTYTYVGGAAANDDNVASITKS